MDVNVLDFRAKGDGSSLDTEAFQSAIDQCHAFGGGTVHVPQGSYRIGTIELKSNVMLELAFGAVLLASENPKDYRKAYPALESIVMGYGDSPINQDQHLIFAKRACHCGICGHGTIDADGSRFYQKEKFRYGTKQKPEGKEYLLGSWRPGPTIAWLDSEEITLEGVTILNAPMFAVLFMHCRNAIVMGMRIFSEFQLRNSDGIHVKSSQNLLVTNCHIETEDDALCFYTDHWEKEMELSQNTDYSCSHIVVSNCILKTACSGVRVGFMGDEPIRDIQLSNLSIVGAQVVMDVICCGGESGFCCKGHHYTGPRIENIQVSGVIAENTKWGITINAHSSLGATGSVGNLHFERVRISSIYGNYISGTESHPVTNVFFRDCSFQVAGGRVTCPQVPSDMAIFKNETFGFGWLVQNAHRVHFENCELEVTDDFEPISIENCDDVSGLAMISKK